MIQELGRLCRPIPGALGSAKIDVISASYEPQPQSAEPAGTAGPTKFPLSK